MVYNLIIDADSILYTSCYRYQHDLGVELELAYMDFCGTVYGIKSAVWKQLDLQREDTIETTIIFSPKHTFRHDLTSSYKANRKPSDIIGIGDLKGLVIARIGALELALLEADDIVIWLAYTKPNTIISCIDKDVYMHSPVPCFNYKKWEWIDAKTEAEIETNYWVQAIMGDSADGIKGAKGIGIKGAEKLVYDVMEPLTYEKYVSLFESEEDAILSMRLVRLDQFKTGELILWTN